MLLFEFDRLLLRFNAQTPAFAELFQLPPEIGHISRRFPLPLGCHPAANHAPQFIDQP